ncbi:DUF1640 domain-containing protein [Vibrio cyclitrophicus]|uniref:DUF1640 domain-containing protein n=2 Tax=Vibrio cyclitrophicus TaxID=47951 RepID=A0A7Z1MK39_9VIBR|nr:DUF1640 domain-containing protein [Vibrio cyclitrophicus]PMP21139.1 DUF1640 domain-containing protein [Vibrio cyclitrophicus]PMP30514.1 DUF1640 domain-containing protein [Vibrio cyclitrophicus]
MSTILFDTHSFVKKLTEAGMPEKQAEILASEQAQLVENRLATKTDLSVMKKDIVNELTIRFGSMLVIAVAVVATLVKLL